MSSEWDRYKIEDAVCFCLALLLLVWLLTSCCHCRQLAPSTQDSVSVEVRHKTVFVVDTLRFHLPDENRLQVLPDSSHLETSVATSDARINPDGSLTHTLSNKKEEQRIPYEKQKEYRDSTVFRGREITKIVEVERDYTWWDKTQKVAFWVMLAIFFITILYKYLKLKLRL